MATTQNLTIQSVNVYNPAKFTYVPGIYSITPTTTQVVPYTETSLNNTNTYVLGSQSSATTNSSTTTDTTTGYHQLYTEQVQGLYQSYTVSSINGMVTLSNSQGQLIQFQLTQPISGANNSGVDVQFLNGGLAFTSNVDSSGVWTTWVTQGGSPTTDWGKGSVALPVTQLTNPLGGLSLNTLSSTVNATDNLSAAAGLPSSPTPTLSPWNSTTGYGQINLDTALYLATGANPTHIAPPAPSLTTLNWGIGASNFQDAWNAGYTGTGVTIAMIDDGIDTSNSALTNNLQRTVSQSFATLKGTIAGNLGDNGVHGSLVASQMTAANTGTVTNPSPVTGGAYGANLMSLNAFAYMNTTALSLTDSIANAINYAVNNGANVINISVGNSMDSNLLTAMQNASNKGVIITIATGNEAWNTPLGSPALPAGLALGDVIAVGASQYSTTSTQASFSQMANSSTPYNYVDAPGAKVLGFSLSTTVGGPSPIVTDGTSFSAPEVAAEAAVLEQALKIIANPTLALPINQPQLAAAAVHDITVGLVGVNPNNGATDQNPYGAIS